MDDIIRKLRRYVPDCTYRVDVSLGHIEENVKQYGVNFDPVYQRDHVWTERQQSIFVGSLILNYNSIPPLWFRWINGRQSCEVIDGKQRITACLRWVRGEIPAIVHTDVVTELWRKDLSVIDTRAIGLMTTMNWRFVDLNDKETFRFYLMLNDGGSKHTDEELNKVRELYKLAAE